MGEEGTQNAPGAEGSQQQQASGQGTEGDQSQGGQQQQGTEGAQGGQQSGQQGGEQGGKQEGDQGGKGGEKGSDKSLLGGAKADDGKGGSDEGNKDGEQGGEGGAPEAYKVTVPEGMTVDQPLVDNLTPVLQKHKVSQEAFQEIAGVYAKHLQSQQSEANKALTDEFAKTQTEWQEETKKDHGASLKEVLSYGARAIDKLGSVRLREILDDTGIGNHPEMVKFFHRVGKMLSEDDFVDPDTNNPSGGSADLGKIYDHDKK